MSGLSGLLVIQSCRVVVGLLLLLKVKLEFDSGDIFYAGLPIPSSCERLRTQTSNGKQESEAALLRPRPEGLGSQFILTEAPFVVGSQSVFRLKSF